MLYICNFCIFLNLYSLEFEYLCFDTRRGFHVKATVSFAPFYVFLSTFVIIAWFVEQRELDDRPVAGSMVRVSWDVMTDSSNVKMSERYIDADEKTAKHLSFRNNGTNEFMLIHFTREYPLVRIIRTAEIIESSCRFLFASDSHWIEPCLAKKYLQYVNSDFNIN